MNGPAAMRDAPVLVLGTTNEGKLRELVELLTPFDVRCRSLRGTSGAVEVEEVGTTFAENAALKAGLQAQAIGSWVLAEDSGLAVDALGGAPGVYSARFAGPAGPGAADGVDERNNALLLERLADRPERERTARYVCHAALSDPGGRIVAVAAGECRGLIGTRRQGAGGFGYDPLFVVPEYHRTFGELPPAVKAVISHRARAMRAMIPFIITHLRS